MPLDPSIFLQGAALNNQNNQQLLQSLQGGLDNAYKMKALKLEQDKAKQAGLDLDKLASAALIKANLGEPLTPQDNAVLKAFDALETRKLAVDPTTGNYRKVNGSIFDTLQNIGNPKNHSIYPGGRGEKFGSLDPLTQNQMMAESGGDPNAVSPKGAFGLMQIMPETGKDPGFGVTPLQNDSPEENLRLGQDYMKALTDKYGDTKTALMAYNWGSGNVDNWMKQGADPSKVPAETRNYVEKITRGLNIDALQPKTPIQSPPELEGNPAAKQKYLESAAGKLGEAAGTKQAEAPKAESSLRGYATKHQNVDNTINEAIGKTGWLSAGALEGTKQVGGTPAANLEALLNTIAADSAFAELQAMRDASKTGGALGAISEKELALLTSAQAALSQKQSPDQLRANLKKYQEIRKNALKNVKDAYVRDYGQLPPDLEKPDPNAIASPQSDDDYNALPSGAIFIDPDDGKKYRKP